MNLGKLSNRVGKLNFALGSVFRISLEVSVDCNGGCSRTRTCDPLIKSQLLYQLSYTPIAPRAELGSCRRTM
jgi:hypothetical protein